jgi:hypothetical protein
MIRIAKLEVMVGIINLMTEIKTGITRNVIGVAESTVGITNTEIIGTKGSTNIHTRTKDMTEGVEMITIGIEMIIIGIEMIIIGIEMIIIVIEMVNTEIEGIGIKKVVGIRRVMWGAGVQIVQETELQQPFITIDYTSGFKKDYIEMWLLF